MVDNCTSFLQRLLFPGLCVLCGNATGRGSDLCRPCEHELPWLTRACTRCARPLRDTAMAAVCGACQRRPPPFAATLAALQYRRPVDHLIQRLKFDQRLQYARVLGLLLAQRLRDRIDTVPDALVPVPLHPARQRQRGFNQATELARPLARAFGIALAPASCRRVRATETQSLLDRHARRANLRGAFRMAGPAPGSHVAIVDDVVTTGSTVQALARVLRAAGVQRVDVWCVARADHH